MKISPEVDDPRLLSPQCHSLTPVKTVHENPWFSVRDRGGYYCVEYNQSQVAVLPIVDHRAVVMVRVKRPTLGDITLELPAGGKENGESPIEAAARELSEETGIEITELYRFEHLPPLSVTPRFPCMPHIFQIQVSSEEYAARKSHDDEIESVERFKFDTIVEKIIDGEIYLCLPLSILARFLFAHKVGFAIAGKG